MRVSKIKISFKRKLISADAAANKGFKRPITLAWAHVETSHS